MSIPILLFYNNLQYFFRLGGETAREINKTNKINNNSLNREKQ